VVIVDAGGGTIDFSTFSRSGNHNAFEEIAAPQCKNQSLLPFFR
jgi:molecular chaperone DnaK (HSP70)